MQRENYLDPDVCYLLGLLVARGEVSSGAGDPVVAINFPHRSLEAHGINTSYEQEHHVLHNLLVIKDRIQTTLGHPVTHSMQPGRGTIIINFPGRPMSFRNIELHMGSSFGPRTSRVPKAMFKAPADFKKEFLRGFADCAGFIRTSNAYMDGRHRVYLQIANPNWFLPIDICAMLQIGLQIPVQSIQWGHPNIRTPKNSVGTGWAKEHQLRVFAEDFVTIGFHVGYKDEILNELAQENRKVGGEQSLCNPNKSIRQIRRKPKHRGEKSEKLPSQIRHHFDAYWQICLKLGCSQCRDVPGLSREMFPDEDV